MIFQIFQVSIVSVYVLYMKTVFRKNLLIDFLIYKVLMGLMIMGVYEKRYIAD